jgi:hypothetical protein
LAETLEIAAGCGDSGQSDEADQTDKPAVKIQHGKVRCGWYRATAPFIASATKTGRDPVRAARDRARAAGNRGTSTLRRTTADRERLARIRNWAHASGYQLKDRGRIPADVITAYEQAQQPSPEPPTRPKRSRRTKTVPPAQFTAP